MTTPEIARQARQLIDDDGIDAVDTALAIATEFENLGETNAVEHWLAVALHIDWLFGQPAPAPTEGPS